MEAQILKKQKFYPYITEVLTYILPPVTVMAVLLFVFWRGGFYPFGEKSIAWCDMSQQTVPMLAALRSALRGESSLLYSFSQAGGVGIFPAICFFVLSPFSLISLLYEPEGLMLAANVIVLVKLTAAAVAAAVFFRCFWPRLGLLCRSALSVMYALCGFSLMYFQTLTWLDTLILFPLLIVAFRRLASGHKPLAFTLLLASLMTTGFYMSIMVIIFLMIFSLMWLFCFTKPEEHARVAADFALSGVCAALLASPVLITALREYLDSARSEGVLEQLAKESGTGDLPTKLPLLMCAAAVLPLGVWYLTEGRHLSGGRRYGFLTGLAAVMLVPFFAERINLMWHFGSYQAFPCRFAYITVLILLSVCAETLCISDDKRSLPAGKEKARGRFARGVSVLSAFAVPVAALCTGAYLIRSHLKEMSKFSRSLWGNKDSFYWLGIAFLVFALCYLLIFALRRNRGISRRLFGGVFALLAVIECGFNGTVYLGNISGAQQRWSDAFAAVSQIDESSGDYYRVKTRSKLFDVNWPAAFGQNSLGHYTSLTGEDYLFSLKRLGYSGYWMEIGSHGSSDFVDGLLCHRYVIEDDRSLSSPECFFGLGVLMDGKPSEQLPDEARPEIQNRIFNEIVSGGRLFEQYKPVFTDGVELSEADGRTLLRLDTDEGIIQYTISVGERTRLYFDCFDALSTKLTEPINNSVSVTVNGCELCGKYPTKTLNGMLLLGEFENETVDITLRVKKSVRLRSFGVWGMDCGLLEAECGGIVSGVLSAGKSSLNGSFTAEKDGWLLIQIPFDGGFAASVNGEKAELSRAYGTFMALPVSAGENDISIRFFPRGMAAGLILFAAGAALTALFCSRFGRGFANAKGSFIQFLQNAVYVVYLAAAAFVFLAVYLLCWFI